MGSRTYGQNCGLARTLDVVGDRWSLLLLRELGLGPRRYKDIAAGLPGMGPNLLSERLRALERAGVVERVTLSHPSGARGYALTPAGEELRPALDRMTAWGLRHGAPFDAEDVTRGEWALHALLGGLRAAGTSDVAGAVAVAVEGVVGCFEPTPDGWRLHLGTSSVPPRLTLVVDAATLFAIASEGLSPTEAIRRGDLVVVGEVDEADRLLRACRDALALPRPGSGREAATAERQGCGPEVR